MPDSNGQGGNFFGRWSERKVQARTGALPADAPAKPANSAKPNEPARPVAEGPQTPLAQPLCQPLAAAGAGLQPEAPAKPLPPTLEDVAKLTADSDYSGFAARTVDPNVRNAAMRKLFAVDPHFNLMDGLDVYIDDYSVGEPIPKAMLRQMVQARSLGLLDDELVDQDKPPSAERPAELAANDTSPLHDENTDLQLQRDDAAGHSGVVESAQTDDYFDDQHADQHADQPSAFHDAKPVINPVAHPVAKRPG